MTNKPEDKPEPDEDYAEESKPTHKFASKEAERFDKELNGGVGR